MLLPLKWMYPNLLMHSSTEGHPGFFKFIVIMNRAGMLNYILVCIWTQFLKAVV